MVLCDDCSEEGTGKGDGKGGGKGFGKGNRMQAWMEQQQQQF